MSDETGSGWIGSVLGDVLERMKALQAEAEKHAATCTARPCERCQRYVCRECKAPVTGSDICEACWARDSLARLLRPTRESVPPHFRWAFEATVERLRGRVQSSDEMIRRGLENPPSTSLLFLGNTGAGKTSFAVAMLDAWVRQDPAKRTGARFVEAGWLARARARHRLGEESPLMTDALTCPLLVLDDLGNEREDRDGCINDVVYGRSNAELPTWITCGLALKEVTVEAFAAQLANRYDGGFVRRIIEHGKRVTLGSPRQGVK